MDMEKERLVLLAAFIKFLKRKIDFNFNISDFNSRLRLQKYVFIAKFFGLDLGYNFNLYIHGPYSPELANDYYRIGDNLEKYEEHSLDFEKDAFIELIRNKNEEWLEAAATILMVSEDSCKKDIVIKIVQEIKPRFSKKFLDNIIKELEKSKLTILC